MGADGLTSFSPDIHIILDTSWYSFSNPAPFQDLHLVDVLRHSGVILAVGQESSKSESARDSKHCQESSAGFDNSNSRVP